MNLSKPAPNYRRRRLLQDYAESKHHHPGPSLDQFCDRRRIATGFHDFDRVIAQVKRLLAQSPEGYGNV